MVSIPHAGPKRRRWDLRLLYYILTRTREARLQLPLDGAGGAGTIQSV